MDAFTNSLSRPRQSEFLPTSIVDETQKVMKLPEMKSSSSTSTKVKISLRKPIAVQLRMLFDLQQTETLPADHINEPLQFLFDELRQNPHLKARFWRHMSEARKRREQVHVGSAAKRQRRYRERLRSKRDSQNLGMFVGSSSDPKALAKKEG